MANPRDARGDKTESADEVQQLRDRVKELEKQLRVRDVTVVDSGIQHAAGGRPILLTAALTANALMVYPAFLTIRRWYRWWT